ncbi:hypothetical protein ACIQVN_32410 [Streptomyces cyaneofuscatus]|uniref:hypothetical protein n=1 Tax=Streptomyces cyaneofuscatus TaxID=66883 RepID=UPI003818B5B9
MDLRGTELNPDQLGSLRLAGPEESGVEAGSAVTETMQSGSSLTVGVAEFADPVDPFLWVLQQPPTFLLETLRDGIAGLGDTPLGTLLASGSLVGEPARTEVPAAGRPGRWAWEGRIVDDREVEAGDEAEQGATGILQCSGGS